MPHYQVVEVKQKSMLKGRITAQDLQLKINKYAHHGWELDKIVSGETASFILGGKDLFLLIFHQEYQGPELAH